MRNTMRRNALQKRSTTTILPPSHWPKPLPRRVPSNRNPSSKKASKSFGGSSRKIRLLETVPTGRNQMNSQRRPPRLRNGLGSTRVRTKFLTPSFQMNMTSETWAATISRALFVTRVSAAPATRRASSRQSKLVLDSSMPINVKQFHSFRPNSCSCVTT